MKKSLLNIAILTVLCSGIAFSSGFSSNQNKGEKASAATTEIKPYAKYDFTANSSDNPGRDISGNGFDLKKHTDNIEGSSFNINSSDGIKLVNATGYYTEHYVTAHNGYSLYAPELGSSGYDLSDMIEGSYTINFTTRFDPTVKNPGQYIVSFGIYEDCTTMAAYSEYSKTTGKWSTFIELQLHNSGVEGLTYNTENSTSDNGRIMDTLVYRYVIQKEGFPDLLSNFKNVWHNYSIVGDASHKTIHFYIDGVEAPLYNRYFNTKYDNGIYIDQGIKLTDLTGQLGRSYTFAIGSQLTINGGSGDQFGTFDMKNFTLYNCALSAANCASVCNNGIALMENESNYRIITKLELDEEVNLEITDVNSVSSLIAGGKLPKNVTATLSDGSTVKMPVFWYDDPDEGVNKIYGIPSIGKYKDANMPDDITGIYNPNFLKATKDYKYVVDFDYDPANFSVTDIKIGGKSTSLEDLPKEISFTKGSTTEVTFNVTCLKDHGELAKVMYDAANWPPIKSGNVYNCSVRVGKGACIKLVLGIETGTITYCKSNGTQIASLVSTYSYGGSEDLLPLETVNAKLSPNSYTTGYYSDPACTQPFTKENLDYYNVKNFNLYAIEVPLKSSYNLNIDMSSNGGTVSGNKAHYDYDENDPDCFKSDITVTPASGYLIDSVSWNSEVLDVGEDPRLPLVIKHSFTSDVTLTIRFRKLNTYMITVQQSGEGTITRKVYQDGSDKPIDGSFDDPYYEGDEIHISIAPKSGYVIESVEFGGQLMPLTAENKIQGYTIPWQKIYKNYNLNVKFGLPKTYTVTINGAGEGKGGSATGNKESYNLGDKTAINLKPDANYHIANVMWGAETLSLADIKEDGSLDVVKDIADNVTLTVYFEADKYYSVNASYNNVAGTVENLSSTYKDKAFLTGVTVTANSGYTIQSIIWGNYSVNITNHQTMNLESLQVSSAVASGGVCSLTVIFAEAEKNTIYVSKSSGGSVVGDTQYASDATECEFTITPDAGYNLKSVKWNDVDVTSEVQPNGKITCTIASTSSFLVVKFEKASSGQTSDTVYQVENKSSSFVGYYVYGLDDRIFVKDSDVSLTIAPVDGFEIQGVQITKGVGEVTSSNGIYFISIVGLTGDTEFSVTVNNTKVNKCSVNTNNEHISVYGVENNKYYTNETRKVSVSADEGYYISKISVGTTEISLPTGVNQIRGYVFDLVIDSNVSITAYCNQISNTKVLVSQNAYDGGEISGIDSSGYLPGTYATITVKAETGYMIQSVTFDGKQVEITNTTNFTFTVLVNEATTITASFTPKTGVTITAYVKNNDLGNVEGTDGYEIGETTAITISASTGAYIESVQWNGKYLNIGDGLTYVIQEVISEENNIVNVAFASLSSYKVTVDDFDNERGSVSGVKESYIAGEITDITVTANSGYEILSVVFGGKNVDLVSKTTLNIKQAVNTNVTLTIVFKESVANVYKVLLLNNDGGEIEDLRTQYNPGSEVSFTVNAASNRVIYRIAINGEEVKITNTSTMTVEFTIEKDTTIDILFANPEYLKTAGGCVNTISTSIAVIGCVSVMLLGCVILKGKRGKVNG